MIWVLALVVLVWMVDRRSLKQEITEAKVPGPVWDSRQVLSAEVRATSAEDQRDAANTAARNADLHLAALRDRCAELADEWQTLWPTPGLHTRFARELRQVLNESKESQQ